MDEKKINTIEMTRKIRDEHARHLAGKTHAEQIAFYRARAKRMEKKLPDLALESALEADAKKEMAVRQIREKRAPYNKKKKP
jgi:hypothetical protein